MASQRASWTTVSLLVGLGVLFDAGVNRSAPGLALTLFFWIVGAVLIRVVPSRPANRGFLAASASFSVFFLLRDAPDLWVLDLGAVSGLLGLAVTWQEPVLAASPGLLLRSAFALIGAALRVPAFLLSPLAPIARRFRLERVKPGLRTAAIAIPVVGLFALLLATADRVFANVITPSLPNWNLSAIASHVIPIGMGTFGAAVLWRAALSPKLEAIGPSLDGRVRSGEWTAILGGIDLLFVIFVIVQFAVLFGGNKRVEVTPGLTYAEYARSGFFQLLAVAGLVLGVVLATWTYGERERPNLDKRFRILVTTMIGLSFLILASAFLRMSMYEHAFGFTLLRLYATVVLAVIGAVLAAAMIYIWTGHRDRFLATAVATALAALLAINLLGTGRFVAARNADRFRSSGKIDAGYNSALLGADAVPVIAALSGYATGADAAALREGLCQQAISLGNGDGLRGWNMSRVSARAALVRAGITPETCSSAPSK